MNSKYACILFKGTTSEFFKISLFIFGSLIISIPLLLSFNAVDLLIYFFPIILIIFLIYFVRFRFNKRSNLYNGYFNLSNNSITFYTEKGDFFKEILFNELSENIQFKRIFSYDDKNIQAILKLSNREIWTILVNQDGADAIKNLKREAQVDYKALKKVPLYMHFIAFMIISFYLLMIYFYITSPENPDARNTILLFTTLPVLLYYFRLLKESKTTISEK